MRPQETGIVELHDTKQKERGFGRQRNRRIMVQGKYIAKNGDEEAQIRIEGIKVFCPLCGEEANLIWSVANGYHHASWHCHCQATESNGWKGWSTRDPEPFREKQQRFKNLFDFSNDESQ